MALPSPAVMGPALLERRARRNRRAETVVCRPVLAGGLIALGDICAVTVALCASVLVRHAAGGQYPLSLYFQLWPILALFVAAYALFDLYPGVVASAVPEIRRSAAATTAVFLILSELTFLLRVVDVYSRLAFLMAWVLALAAVPLARFIVRKLFAGKRWWGYPVVAFGDGRMVRSLVRNLRQKPQYGLRPIAVVDRRQREETAIEGVPAYSSLDHPALACRDLGPARGMVVLPGLSGAELADILSSHATLLPRLLIVPGLEGVSSLEVEAKDICRVLMLETRNRLLLPWPRLVKRLLDVTCAAAAGLVALPLLALIAAVIRLESPGPVFYGHTRIGRNGRRIKVWKFRSMVIDAAQVLERRLRDDPALAAEWRLNRKLKHDPRVTRFGRLLRRTSLDELPQLWNVLRGEMSLVGPRPIVTDEIEMYEEAYELYTRVRPGLTGLWQVSGRNDTTYEERVGLDTYYVRNWSPWLDIYVLARTVTAVLDRAGAY